MDKKKLVNKILQASALINNKSTRGSGNYIVANQTISSMLWGYKIQQRKDKIKRLFDDKTGKIR